MDEKVYTILYKKETLDSEKKIYSYIPCYVICGIYDNNDNVFLDELNKIRYRYDDPRSIEENSEYCIGYAYSINDLKNKYKEKEELEYLIYKLFNDEEQYITLGYYKDNIIHIKKMTNNNLICDNSKTIESNIVNLKNKNVKEEDIQNLIKIFQISSNDNITISKIKELGAEEFYYQMQKKELNSDFVELSLEEAKKIIDLEDYDELLELLQSIKQDRKSYYKKYIKSMQDITKGTIIYEYDSFDDLINEMIETKSYDEVKARFSMLFAPINGFLDIINELCNINEDNKENIDKLMYISVQELKDVANNTYKRVSESDDISKLKSELQHTLLFYKIKYDEIIAYEQAKDCELKITTIYIEEQIDTISEIIEHDDLETIKKEYCKLYENTIEVMIDVEQELGFIREEKKVLKAKDLDTEIDNALSKLDSLVGMENVKNEFEDIFSNIIFTEKTKDYLNFENENHNLVFLGNPGTGKTTVAEIVSPLFHKLGYVENNKVAYIAAQDIIADYVGQTAHKTENLINKYKGGVIFLDEAYILSGKAQLYGNEAITVILKEMEKNRTVFIFSGYKKEMSDFIKINSGLKSRIGTYIEFKDYTEDELIEIFNNTIEDTAIDKDQQYKLSITEEALDKVRQVVKKVIKIEDFGNGRFIKNLFSTINKQHAKNTRKEQDNERLYKITEDDIPDNLIEKVLFDTEKSDYSSTSIGFGVKVKTKKEYK